MHGIQWSNKWIRFILCLLFNMTFIYMCCKACSIIFLVTNPNILLISRVISACIAHMRGLNCENPEFSLKKKMYYPTFTIIPSSISRCQIDWNITTYWTIICNRLIHLAQSLILYPAPCPTPDTFIKPVFN